MRKIVLLISLLIVSAAGMKSYSQDFPYQKGLEPVSLTPDELFVLSRVPALEVPERYKGADAPLMPVSVDNSTQPYFRTITAQSGYECGQSAGICFNFTYELDRLRGVPATTTANLYPSHFAWDFLNNGDNYQGASFFDSWEILRACGTMNVADYGGAVNTGGYLRWISGYDKYYNGMQNRINAVKAIRVDTPEGLQTLKYWLFDHLEGATVGGVANIYGQYFSPTNTFAPGTPEGGKFVQNNWGSSPSHAWTICGYNDSIRFDFNGDGQYTNNIDINGDGVVNMKDWEKGGLKFANGYAGTGWSNQGFCYTMYKNLADNAGYGGIWNHTVYVLNIKSSCSPRLTMKVALKHTSRNKIKVSAGLSTDLAATAPSVVQEFPVFNYQGGDHYMQGGSTEADKTIEFGLDLAPLISQIDNNQPAKYFLQVTENDPAGAYPGEIVSWSLVDYTPTTPITTTYPATGIPLVNNDITRLGMNYTLGFSKPFITNSTLPPAQLYQPYSATLSATGGAQPYRWDAKLDYPESMHNAGFPAITTQQLTLTNNNTGYAVKQLDFNFPFYNRFVNKLYIYADGYIVFDDQPFTYPYLIDKMLLFRQTGIISPFMTDLAIYPSSSQGVWYEGSPNYAIVRWKASVYNMQGTTEVNVAVKFYPNGTLEYYYGNMVYPTTTKWIGGLSCGDNRNYQFTALNNAGTITANTYEKFTSCGFPPEMQITEDGHFAGVPANSYTNLPIKFRVTDNNNISTVKTLLFNTYGLMINQTIVSGGDSLIEFGETAYMSVTVNNMGSQVLHNVVFSLAENDPYITLVDSTESVPVINGNQNITLGNAFTFLVSPNVPDYHAFSLTLHVQATEGSIQRVIDLVAHAPVFRITSTSFPDGDNGVPDAGESSDLLVTYKNLGSTRASLISVLLSSADTNITVNTGSVGMPNLKPDSSRTVTFHVTAGNSAPAEHLFLLKSNLTANNSFSCTDTVYLFSGRIVEDFETGNFNKFPWYSAGQWPWAIASGVKYEGNYSARSGVITDNAESILQITARVLADGDISFYKYVSCQQDPTGNKNTDYMAFLVDNYELARWDGIIPWSFETFHVTSGVHTFSWVYRKDGGLGAGWDGCILDFITLPLIEGAVPQLAVAPPFIEKTVHQFESVTDSLVITNTGGGILKYSVMVFDTAANKKDYLPDNLAGSTVTCSEDVFTPGQSISWVFTVHNQGPDNEYIRHIKMDFPPGVIINGATNFAGGSLGELVFQGTPGNTASLNWHGESTGGRGVLKPGETAVATVTGTIGETFMNDVFVVYALRGDSTGTTPHEQAGSVKVKSAGIANNWVTLVDPAGSLMHNQSGTVYVNLNAAGLIPGTYQCSLVARDLYNNRVVVPVTLHVGWPVGNTGPAGVMPTAMASCRPNPFAGETVVIFNLAAAGDAVLEISTLQGTTVRTWRMSGLAAGVHEQNWDGNDDHGHALPAGVYICRMKTGDYQGSLKMIMIR
jgi:hypothetical protein